MHIKLGIRVFSSDDQPVGSVSHVVIDPETQKVVALVIQKGLLFDTDRLASVSSIYSTDEKRIVLEQATPDLVLLPQFQFDRRVLAGPDGREMRGPTGASVATASSPQEAEAPEVTQNIPAGAVALKKEARVITSDGHPVGHVERIITAFGEERITHLVLSKGLLLRARKLIPVNLISHVMEDEVDLMVDTAYLDGINIVDFHPELHPGEPI